MKQEVKNSKECVLKKLIFGLKDTPIKGYNI
jgi:hypothetical protein